MDIADPHHYDHHEEEKETNSMTLIGYLGKVDNPKALVLLLIR